MKIYIVPADGSQYLTGPGSIQSYNSSPGNYLQPINEKTPVVPNSPYNSSSGNYLQPINERTPVEDPQPTGSTHFVTQPTRTSSANDPQVSNTTSSSNSQSNNTRPSNMQPTMTRSTSRDSETSQASSNTSYSGPVSVEHQAGVSRPRPRYQYHDTPESALSSNPSMIRSQNQTGTIKPEDTKAQAAIYSSPQALTLTESKSDPYTRLQLHRSGNYPIHSVVILILIK